MPSVREPLQTPAQQKIIGDCLACAMVEEQAQLTQSKALEADLLQEPAPKLLGRFEDEPIPGISAANASNHSCPHTIQKEVFKS